ncbi:MAG TPA: VIT and VWA domain-containing protein [Burkholderiales bacterium]|nr:VIT and VWA domain-containing protein [Burkholderiales bacterium]
MTQHEQHPSLRPTRGRTVPVLERIDIRARATAPLLDVTAEQHYANASRRTLEVVYTFPVPPRAVLLGLEFTLGERNLTGVVRAKREASDTYDRAVGDGDSAVLVEAQRDGLYTANLGNLKPGERAVIRIRYGQLLEAQGEDWRIAIPTVLAPFYGDAERDGGLYARAAPTQSLAAEYPLALTLELPGATDPATLRCTSHRATVEPAIGALVARLPDDAWLDRDVVFLARREPHAAAIAGRDGDHAVVVASAVLGSDDVADRPVSLRLVLDCSGSMAGESMDWAAVGCQRIVDGLRDDDEFSITRFGSTVDHWTPRMLEAAAENRSDFARRLLDVVADLGGTEMEQALRAAAQLRSVHERSEIVLVTDGEIWASDALVRWARGSGLRVFAIGVGSAPNQALLQRLAEETGGSCEFVSPGEDMIHAVQRVLARLRAPRRESIDAAWPVRPDWSLQLPAVAHAGQTVHVVAGFEAAPIGSVTVAGKAIALPGRETVDDTLARVAAYQRLLSGHFADPAAAAEQYQLVTEWTSLVAVLARADGDKAVGLPQIAKVDHMLAAGWGGAGTAAAVWRSRSAPVARACMMSPPVQERADIAAFLRQDSAASAGSFDADERFLECRVAAPDEAEVRALRHQLAVRHRSDELSAWIRAINRRVVVESLTAYPARPTLSWLAACVAHTVVQRLEQEVRGGLDESAVVLAFIEGLSAMAPDLDEGLSEFTRRWLQSQCRATHENNAAHHAAQRVLDAYLGVHSADAEEAATAAGAGA